MKNNESCPGVIRDSSRCFLFVRVVLVRAIAAKLPKINSRRGQVKDELIVKRNKPSGYLNGKIFPNILVNFLRCSICGIFRLPYYSL